MARARERPWRSRSNLDRCPWIASLRSQRRGEVKTKTGGCGFSGGLPGKLEYISRTAAYPSGEAIGDRLSKQPDVEA